MRRYNVASQITSSSIARYRAELLKERGGLVPDHPEPVATTWSLSFEKIEQSNPAAADLLRVCAFLQPDAIPEEILLEGAQHLGQEVQQLSANPLAFDQALKALFSYSLIQRNRSERLLSVHRLVQAVLYDAMTEPEHESVGHASCRSSQYHLSKVSHEVREQCERLLPHVIICTTALASPKLSLELASLLYKAADYLVERAQYNQAEILYQQTLSIREQVLGSEHLDVAQSLHGLAILYWWQNRLEEAEPLLQRILLIREQRLGPEHPDVAKCLNTLAVLYARQAKFTAAEPLLQRTLSIREQTLGSEHPDVAISLQNLALVHKNQGKYAEAEPLYQRALQIREQAHGPKHPDVAYPLSNLAIVYKEPGKYEKAEPLYQRALHIWEQTLGPEHSRCSLCAQ